MRLRHADLPSPRCPWLGEAVRRTTAQPSLRPNRGEGEAAAGAGEGLWRAARLPQASRSSLHSRRETWRNGERSAIAADVKSCNSTATRLPALRLGRGSSCWTQTTSQNDSRQGHSVTVMDQDKSKATLSPCQTRTQQDYAPASRPSVLAHVGNCAAALCPQLLSPLLLDAN